MRNTTVIVTKLVVQANHLLDRLDALEDNNTTPAAKAYSVEALRALAMRLVKAAKRIDKAR